MATKQDKTVQASGVDLVIEGTGDSNNIPQYYTLCNIKSVEAQYVPNVNALSNVNGRIYPYDQILRITIHFNDTQGQVSKLEFDIQSVTNQAGWTANEAGLRQAAADIASWKTSACASAGAGGGGMTEATGMAILAELADDKDFELFMVRDTLTLELFQLRVIRNQDTGAITYEYYDANNNVVVPVNNLEFIDHSSALSIIATYSQSIGNTFTQNGIDGDLQTIDTDAEALALDPTANTGGSADVSYTLTFMYRWMLRLIQSVRSVLPASLGQKTMANSFPVVISSDQSNVPVTGNVGGFSKNISASFARPNNTTDYASGDLIANSTTAGDVVPLTFSNASRTAAGSFLVRRFRLHKSGTSITLAKFRLHVFRTSPTATALTNGDNGALAVVGLPAGDYIGYVDLDMTTNTPTIFNNGRQINGVPSVGSEMTIELASGQAFYGLLEARDAYTPGSGEVFTVTAEILQD